MREFLEQLSQRAQRLGTLSQYKGARYDILTMGTLDHATTTTYIFLPLHWRLDVIIVVPVATALMKSVAVDQSRRSPSRRGASSHFRGAGTAVVEKRQSLMIRHPPEFVEMAKELGLTPKQVEGFFQNEEKGTEK